MQESQCDKRQRIGRGRRHLPALQFWFLRTSRMLPGPRAGQNRLWNSSMMQLAVRLLSQTSSLLRHRRASPRNVRLRKRRGSTQRLHRVESLPRIHTKHPRKGLRKQTYCRMRAVINERNISAAGCTDRKFGVRTTASPGTRQIYGGAPSLDHL